MMDFIKQISNYLMNNVTLNAQITSPILKSDSSSVAIRETPSSVSNRYMSKEKTIEFQFQIFVKDPGIIKAREMINQIADKLDGLPPGTVESSEGSFLMTKCECYSTPGWVETNEHDEHIFTALFTAQLERGGNL
jgi:hypothetical protein